MKKSFINSLLFLGIMFITNITSKAQFKADGQFVQGSAIINQSLGNNADRAKQFSTSVDWGKYKAKKSANIYSFSLAFQQIAPSTTNSNSDTKSFTIGLGRGQEFYKTLIDKFTMYGRVMGSINYYKNETSSSDNKGVNLNLFGSGGIMYPINQQWLITAQLLQVNVATVNYEWGKFKTNVVIPPNAPRSGNRLEQNSASDNSTTFNELKYNFNPYISFSYGLGVRYVIK